MDKHDTLKLHQVKQYGLSGSLHTTAVNFVAENSQVHDNSKQISEHNKSLVVSWLLTDAVYRCLAHDMAFT